MTGMAMEIRKIIQMSLAHGRHLVITTVAVVGLLAGVLVQADDSEKVPLLLAVFAVGTVGGLLNTYRRFNLIPSASFQTEEIASWQITLQIYMSPLIGGLFGLVLYLFFLTGIVISELFPKIECVEEKYQSFTLVLNTCIPDSNKDAAKTLFWAFIGGFSEWFVPNLLDRFARKPVDD